jgi:catechol 2,3-dioxygenase-like lactoylglutathione lyase family enzyme
MPIVGMHVLVYSKEAEATREFFRDVLGFPAVDAGDGWLILAAPPTELAVHPAADAEYHELYLMCEDIMKTTAELEEKGVVTGPVEQRRWGRVTYVRLPSGDRLGLYEPQHPTAIGTPEAPLAR